MEKVLPLLSRIDKRAPELALWNSVMFRAYNVAPESTYVMSPFVRKNEVLTQILGFNRSLAIHLNYVNNDHATCSHPTI